ncbi:hypothetical protein GCM10011611_36380 [Aliidongia dinghuensis]|uniref:Uncharacterized protein n=1 Tax=Aliidongia dinghuensis TaxID=1867774 RepID=A0A8J2YVB2_9PROT|nr:hypothetical protein [Aliidongia dinghuensis]GGF27070.1 hypothetical protein GCM10011611_36380 [Aliidongia dinghuensis]
MTLRTWSLALAATAALAVGGLTAAITEQARAETVRAIAVTLFPAPSPGAGTPSDAEGCPPARR